MSDCRSPYPSLSVDCQRAERFFSSSARSLASLSFAMSCSALPGSVWASISIRIRWEICSTAERTSWAAERRSRTSACALTRSRRKVTRVLNPDSSLRAGSLEVVAARRSTDEVGSSSAATPARVRWLRSRSAMRRHSGYRSVLVSTHATFGHSEIAWVRNAQLGLGVLLRGVRDEQHRVRRGERPHRHLPVRRSETADPRGVDDDEPLGQDAARDPDLDVADVLPVARGCPPRRRSGAGPRSARRCVPRATRRPRGRAFPHHGDRRAVPSCTSRPWSPPWRCRRRRDRCPRRPAR